MIKVLLTGITGFLGSHTAIQLLQKGYEVIGTLRDMKRAESIKNIIAQHTSNTASLHFVEADLAKNTNWKQLTQGIDYVLHIASPFPQVLPKNENDLIIPAKKGTLDILEASLHNQVKRIVITSSSGAIVYGKGKNERNKTFTEQDWSNENNRQDNTPYFRSKTIAEKAAWEFIKQHNNALKLVTICPGAILGPILEKDFGTSANIVLKQLDGSVPAIPRIGFEMVDVRSVADMHLKAIEVPQAAGERFACSAGYLSFKQVADILRKEYPNRKIPTFMLPDFAVKLFANIDPTLKPILIELGTKRRLDHSKAQKILNWQPISNQEAVLACAKSAIQLGLIK